MFLDKESGDADRERGGVELRARFLDLAPELTDLEGGIIFYIINFTYVKNLIAYFRGVEKLIINTRKLICRGGSFPQTTIRESAGAILPCIHAASSIPSLSQ